LFNSAAKFFRKKSLCTLDYINGVKENMNGRAIFSLLVNGLLKYYHGTFLKRQRAESNRRAQNKTANCKLQTSNYQLTLIFAQNSCLL